MNSHDPAPGANDDASGVAVSLECARVLTQARGKFPASLVFVAVAGEEQGLNGSAHLAKLAKSEGWDLEAVLNNDIVGGDTTPGDTLQDKGAVRVFSEGVPGAATLDQLHQIQSAGAENDSPSRELARAVLDVASTYFGPTQQRAPIVPGRPHSMLVRVVPAFHPVLIFRRDRFLRGGDHTSFNLEGFPAVRFTEWRENFDHQHQNVRVESGIAVRRPAAIRRSRVRRQRRPPERRHARGPRARPRAATQRPRPHRQSGQQHAAHLGRALRLPRWRQL